MARGRISGGLGEAVAGRSPEWPESVATAWGSDDRPWEAGRRDCSGIPGPAAQRGPGARWDHGLRGNTPPAAGGLRVAQGSPGFHRHGARSNPTSPWLHPGAWGSGTDGPSPDRPGPRLGSPLRSGYGKRILRELRRAAPPRSDGSCPLPPALSQPAPHLAGSARGVVHPGPRPRSFPQHASVLLSRLPSLTGTDFGTSSWDPLELKPQPAKPTGFRSAPAGPEQTCLSAPAGPEQTCLRSTGRPPMLPLAPCSTSPGMGTPTASPTSSSLRSRSPGPGGWPDLPKCTAAPRSPTARCPVGRQLRDA